MISDKVSIAWNISIAIFIAIIAAVGAVTRLTESGLSITVWEPIVGLLPPLTEAEWLSYFNSYKATDEYRYESFDLGLGDFKFIFFWEWFHRFMARLLGLVIVIPTLFMLFKSKKLGYSNISEGLKNGLVMSVFVCLQGFIGWWMVKSGLTQRLDVSQYRLAFHLFMASVMLSLAIGYSMRSYFALTSNRLRAAPVVIPIGDRKIYQNFYYFVNFLLLLVFAQIIMGALVSGNNAGLIYNTWPLMGEGFISEGLQDKLLVGSLTSVDFFEDHALVQFNHRVMAIVIFVVALLTVCFRIMHKDNLKLVGVHWSWAVFAIVGGQFFLGVITLLSFVNIILAVLHHVFALILLSLLSGYKQKLKHILG